MLLKIVDSVLHLWLEPRVLFWGNELWREFLLIIGLSLAQITMESRNDPECNMLFSAHINPLLLSIRACSLNPAQTSPILLECSIMSPITPFYHSVMFRLTMQPMIMEKVHSMGSVIQFSGALPRSSKSLHRRRLSWSHQVQHFIHLIEGLECKDAEHFFFFLDTNKCFQ